MPLRPIVPPQPDVFFPSSSSFPSTSKSLGTPSTSRSTFSTTPTATLARREQQDQDGLNRRGDWEENDATLPSPSSSPDASFSSFNFEFDSRLRIDDSLDPLTTPPPTPSSPMTRSSLTSSEISPREIAPFDPVVGGNGPSTPSRLRSSRFDNPSRFISTSLPITPCKPDSTQNSTSGYSPAIVRSVNSTWPTRSSSSIAHQDEGEKMNFRQKETTPTKLNENLAPPEFLVTEDIEKKASLTTAQVSKKFTRYVMIEGVSKASSESDLRTQFVDPCSTLSLAGCLTSRLHDEGLIVLVFHDIRDSLVAVQHFASTGSDYDNLPRSPPLSGLLRARCITREAFQQLRSPTLPNPLLSASEGVLVLTLVGPPLAPSLNPMPLLSIYGTIRTAKVVEDRLYVIEYFDDRSGEMARRGLDGKGSGGWRFSCSFEPTVATSMDSTLPSYPGSPPTLLTSLPILDNSTPLLTPAQTPTYCPSSSPIDNSVTSSHSIARLALDHDSSAGWSSYTQQEHRPIQYSSYPLSTSTFDQSSTRSPPTVSPRPQLPSLLANEPLPSAIPQHHTKKSRLPPTYGIVRDDRIPSGNVIDFAKIENGSEVRTTLMLKNVPNKLKDHEVMTFIEEVVGRSFDFFYLRTDYATGCNVGYGFVNFTSMSALLSFCKQRLGTRWNKCSSDKLCVLSFANIQGKASLIAHFKNSSVLDQDESRRPKIFVTSGPNAGEPEKFPMCDDPIRKMRSALNAAHVGLFPSQKPVFKIAQASSPPFSTS